MNALLCICLGILALDAALLGIVLAGELRGWPRDRLRRRRDQKAVERLIREISHTWTDEGTHGD